MIEIALCDDNAEDIEAAKSFAEQFVSEHADFPMRFSAFTSAAELLKQIKTGSSFELFILDVIMPKMSGIQLAETIRSRGIHAEIIFLTISRDYAVDAFSVSACGYLLKPLIKENFDKIMLRTLSKLTRENGTGLAVRTKGGIWRIPLHKIVMIESFNHIREITTTDNSVFETSATLSELFEQLDGHSNFIMPHRAYIVNLDNSVGIVRYEMLMLGNRRIPIPKNQFAAVRNIVQNYFFKRKSL